MEARDQGQDMKLPPLHMVLEKQILALQKQMAKNQAASWQKLKISQEAQQRQAVLVRKLQAKVLQYRNWCQELESRLENIGGPLPERWENADEPRLEQLLIRLDEEHQRSESLVKVNTKLQQHLENADVVNKALQEDMGKLTVDWSQAQDELSRRQSDWQMERKFFKGYLKGEHGRLLSLWREVVTFRRYFLEMKTATDRDLAELKAEHMKMSGSLLTSCLHLSLELQSQEPQGSGSERAHLQLLARIQELEKEINERNQELILLKARGNVEKTELQDRVTELSAVLAQSKKQNEEQEKKISALKDTMDILVCSLFEEVGG
uniref:Rootletin-like coiled-coil domain-containing protein n=1 Tax=Sarcophilus harrisii TaxID=9305 RepID=A0A7N4PTF7_SARHA